MKTGYRYQIGKSKYFIQIQRNGYELVEFIGYNSKGKKVFKFLGYYSKSLKFLYTALVYRLIADKEFIKRQYKQTKNLKLKDFYYQVSETAKLVAKHKKKYASKFDKFMRKVFE